MITLSANKPPKTINSEHESPSTHKPSTTQEGQHYLVPSLLSKQGRILEDVPSTSHSNVINLVRTQPHSPERISKKHVISTFNSSSFKGSKIYSGSKALLLKDKNQAKVVQK